MKKPTHLSLFTGIGGIFTKEKGLLNEIALFRIKTYNAFIKKLACEVFEFAVIFTMFIFSTNHEVIWPVIGTHKVYMVHTRGKKMWREIKNPNQRDLIIDNKHYPFKKFYSHLFDGAGENVVLFADDRKALFAWSKIEDRPDGQNGAECIFFLNGGYRLSSDLIKEACMWAWYYWPGERLFAYVDPKKVRGENPGCSFKIAGWKKYGITQEGVLIFENTNPIDIGQECIYWQLATKYAL